MSNTDHVTVGQLRAYSRGAEATNDARFAKAEALSALSAIINTLIGNDSNKSARVIAAEELAAKLIPQDAKASLDTLQEIAAWIQDHPDDAAAMNSAIQGLQEFSDYTITSRVACFPDETYDPNIRYYDGIGKLFPVATSEYVEGVTSVSGLYRDIEHSAENIGEIIEYILETNAFGGRRYAVKVSDLAAIGDVSPTYNSGVDYFELAQNGSIDFFTSIDDDNYSFNLVDMTNFVDGETDVSDYYVVTAVGLITYIKYKALKASSGQSQIEFADDEVVQLATEVEGSILDQNVEYTGCDNDETYDPSITYYMDSIGAWIVDTSDFEEGVTNVSDYYKEISDGDDGGIS